MISVRTDIEDCEAAYEPWVLLRDVSTALSLDQNCIVATVSILPMQLSLQPQLKRQTSLQK